MDVGSHLSSTSHTSGGVTSLSLHPHLVTVQHSKASTRGCGAITMQIQTTLDGYAGLQCSRYGYMYCTRRNIRPNLHLLVPKIWSGTGRRISWVPGTSADKQFLPYSVADGSATAPCTPRAHEPSSPTIYPCRARLVLVSLLTAWHTEIIPLFF